MGMARSTPNIETASLAVAALLEVHLPGVAWGSTSSHTVVAIMTNTEILTSSQYSTVSFHNAMFS